ncbi:hypothetical protein RUND412_009514 [Rhizina undulata]
MVSEPAKVCQPKAINEMDMLEAFHGRQRKATMEMNSAEASEGCRKTILQEISDASGDDSDSDSDSDSVDTRFKHPPAGGKKDPNAKSAKTTGAGLTKGGMKREKGTAADQAFNEIVIKKVKWEEWQLEYTIEWDKADRDLQLELERIRVLERDKRLSIMEK